MLALLLPALALAQSPPRAACTVMVASEPHAAAGHLCLVDVLEAGHRYDEAIAAARKALAVNDGEQWAAGLALTTLYRFGRYDEAVAIGWEQLKLHRNLDELGNVIGEIEANRGRWSEAASAFRVSIRGHDESIARWGLGTALVKLGDMKGARTQLRELKKEHADDYAVAMLEALLQSPRATVLLPVGL